MFADWLAGATITLGERSQRGNQRDKSLGVEEGKKGSVCVYMGVCLCVCAHAKCGSDDLLLF